MVKSESIPATPGIKLPDNLNKRPSVPGGTPGVAPRGKPLIHALHAVIHYTAMKTVDTFKLKLSCSVTNTSWSEWSSVFASGEHCLRFKHSAAFVSKTLRSLRTHYCVPLEHTTAFDSIRNERSAFASKRRRTHQDVNTNAGFVLFERSCVFSFVFNCSNWNAFALRWQVSFAWTVTYTGSGSI